MNKHEINFQIGADDAIGLSMGDVVYTVEYAGEQQFSGICPVCKDAKRVVVNGYKFKCPRCHGSGGGEWVLAVKTYRVRRWRLSGISEHLQMYSWDPAEGHSHQVVLKFTSTSKSEGPSNFTLNSLPWNPKRIRTGGLLQVFKTSRGDSYADTPIFLNYAEAVKLAEELNDQSRAEVEAYNEKEGMTFEFKAPENDRRSE